jgi:hypothetical protein
LTLPDAVEQAIAGWIEWGRSVPDPLEQLDAIANLGDEALLRFADAVTEEPLDEAKLHVCYRLGHALYERGLVEDARRKFEQVAAAHPGYEEVDQWLAALPPREAPAEPSLPDLSAFADDEIDPTELENARLAGLRAMLAGQPCTADNVGVYYMFAVELMARKQWADAGDVLRAIERVSPGYGDVAVRLVEVECNVDPGGAPPAGHGTGTLYGMIAPPVGTGTFYGMVAPPMPPPAAPEPEPPLELPEPPPSARITPAQPRATVYGFAPTLPTSGDGDDRHERRKTPAMNFAVSTDVQGIYRMSRSGTRPPVMREEFAPKPAPKAKAQPKPQPKPQQRKPERDRKPRR